ncbi:acyl-CoA N-acyltransferase [Hypoxylon trugodes]|uniref:acyl-CoA N-acyltransferase n=1 Tax=Hypoxylon trugodes TaxID=326681 RepID=UPI00219E8C47|nr:acyl-CoA N-acyltransferase [Hypoxylon trugodes]KAI1388800.1 acyl-CoA N-acyltransferase [Hypoxylon trugodes]
MSASGGGEDFPPLSIEGLTLKRASVEDVPAIKKIIDAAYTKYIPRIGKPPAPMLADYQSLLATSDIFILRTADTNIPIGSVILRQDPLTNSLKINNLVVDPMAQGRGYGRILTEYCEKAARAQGRTALTLFTNIKMYENLGLYAKLGFVEAERKIEDGYERVYFRKDLL